MPSERDHSRQAQRNREFLNTFHRETTPYLDWMVTVIFYTALHTIERYLAHQGFHPADHTARDAYLLRVGELKPIWPDYRRLKDESTRARYEVASFTAAEVQKLEERLNRIEAHINSLLSASGSRSLTVHEAQTGYEAIPPESPNQSGAAHSAANCSPPS